MPAAGGAGEGQRGGLTRRRGNRFLDKVEDNAVLEKAIEGFGELHGWSQQKAPIVVAKARAAWGPVKDWTGGQVNKMGTLVHAAVKDHIPELATDAFDGASAALGDVQDWSQAELAELKAKAQAAWGPVQDWSGPKLEQLGSILQEAVREDIPRIGGPAFDLAVDKLGAFGDWSADELTQLKAKATEAWGPVQDWSGARLNRLGSILQEAVREDIPKLSKDAFDLAAANLGAASGWSAEQLGQLKDKAIEAYGPVKTWSDATMVKLGHIMEVAIHDDIPRMSKEVFENFVETFGKVKEFTQGEAAELKAKSLEVWGPVDAWGGAQLTKVGSLLQELVKDDIPKISAAAFRESVEAFGQAKAWTAPQLAELKSKAQAAWGDAAAWSVENVQDLGSMTEAFLMDDVPKLSKEAFKASLDVLGQTRAWSAQSLERAGAKSKQVYGDVASWSQATVRDLGGIVAGLKAVDLPRLSVEASVSLEPAAVENMSPEQTGALQPAQVGAFPQPTKNRLFGAKLGAMAPAARQEAACSSRAACPHSVTDVEVLVTALPGQGKSGAEVVTAVADATQVAEADLELLFVSSADPALATARRRLQGAAVETRYAVRYAAPDAEAAGAFDAGRADAGDLHVAGATTTPLASPAPAPAPAPAPEEQEPEKEREEGKPAEEGAHRPETLLPTGDLGEAHYPGPSVRAAGEGGGGRGAAALDRNAAIGAGVGAAGCLVLVGMIAVFYRNSRRARYSYALSKKGVGPYSSMAMEMPVGHFSQYSDQGTTTNPLHA